MFVDMICSVIAFVIGRLVYTVVQGLAIKAGLVTVAVVAT